MKKFFMTMVGCIWMMAAYAQGPMVRLSNGVEMPQFGIGTFNVPSNGRSSERRVPSSLGLSRVATDEDKVNEACKEAVLTALRAGYRHIDTAHAYMDERGVGDAVNEFIAEGGCKREDIWVTSKIWPSELLRPFFVSEVYTKEGNAWKLVTLAFTKKS